MNSPEGGGVAAVYDGVRKSTFDASLASVAVRGTVALFGRPAGPPGRPTAPQRGGLGESDATVAGALHADSR